MEAVEALEEPIEIDLISLS